MIAGQTGRSPDKSIHQFAMKKSVQLSLEQSFKKAANSVPKIKSVKRVASDECSLTPSALQTMILQRHQSRQPSRHSSEDYQPVFHPVLSEKLGTRIKGYKEKVKTLLSGPSMRQKYGSLCSGRVNRLLSVDRAILNLEDNEQPATFQNIHKYVHREFKLYLTPEQFEQILPLYEKSEQGEFRIKGPCEFSQRAKQLGSVEEKDQQMSAVEKANLLRRLDAVVDIFNKKGVSNVFRSTLVKELGARGLGQQLQQLTERGCLCSVRGGGDQIISLQRQAINKLRKSLK